MNRTDDFCVRLSKTIMDSYEKDKGFNAISVNNSLK